MISSSNIKSWLSYWKKTLIDVDRKRIDVTTYPIPVESYFIKQAPQKHARFLWNASQTNKETQCINVDICPCSIQSEFEHAKSKELEEEVFYPFWIPAIMYKDGTLAPQKSNKGVAKPFFVREYLNPNPKDTYRIASIKDVDTALQKVEFKDESWNSYWEKCESFFSIITGKSFEEFNVKHEKHIFIQKGELRGLTENIRKLYNRLEDTPPDRSLLNNLVDTEKIVFSNIPKKSEVVRNRNHIGQMSGEFPLSVSQRESIACFNLLKESNVLAVNGPPGTGKTTFLQSVVANSVVSTVINQQRPELIIACSANNQAITNILDSFVLDSKDKLTQRWLPDLTSLGLYLSTNENKKYQTCTSEFGNGFLNDFESANVEDKKEHFLKEFKAYLGESDNIEECKSKLLSIVQLKVYNIKESLEIAEEFETISPLLKEAGFSSPDELFEKISSFQDNINQTNTEIQQTSVVEEKLTEAKENQPFLQKVFSFLAKFKKRRASLFQRVLLDINLDNVPDYSNYNALIYLLNERIIAKTNLIKQYNFELIPLVELKNKTEELKSNYLTCLSNWNDNYGEMLIKLQAMTGKEYKDLHPLEDMQVRMDFSYRYEAFWYAIHFREAEYLINLEAKQEKNSKDKERGKIGYKEKLQRFAGVTPIYISTFHSIPRFSTFYNNAEGEKAYFDLFDLLIVDEAGQVAPDIAIPSFSLAKKAIVVGDVFQIEPVWSVEEKLDIVNLKMNNLLFENASDETINSYKDSGKLCSSGNIMKLAQRACFVKDGDEGGTLLKEHRRCPDKIISYSNRNVYQNKLILTKGNKRKANTDLPLKGFMHIDSASEKIGNSRRNIQDAIIIAKWIENKRLELENSFGKKPISDVLAIVTPYKSQASLIKNELLKLNKKVYAKIISGTVHALQGAEIDVVIFSTVLTPGNSTFFADNLNMLNVAVSRAKSSFLVFGNLNTIDATKNNPLGRLKQWLQEDEDCELSNKIIFDSKETEDGVKRINDLKTHVGTLNRAFEIAKSELIIVSPFISSNAIECEALKCFDNSAKETINSIEIESVKKQLRATVNKGVKVLIITDSTLDTNNNQLKPNAKKGREIIEQSGAKLKLVDGIHSKTIIIDNDIIIDGSFNWFSALRDEQSKYFREESSIVVKGEPAKTMIKKAKAYLTKVVK
ncbi:AAA domain-containing protein [Labilibacter marinus]|uniref:AAA domain-containing protein n=1 Tax=Labilibacter marinus TaxID=1477105 RepID=UPI00095004B5|nr:AAA domain-containing protein [Labilibacter marinus]